MSALINRSIKTKLVLLSTIAAAAGLLVCSMALIASHVGTLRASKRTQLETVADVLACNSTAIVRFRDAAAGARLLQSLRRQPSVEVAYLYDRDGQKLAAYARDGRRISHSLPRAENVSRFDLWGRLEVVRGISDHGEDVGSLYLRADASEFRAQMSRYAVIVVGAIAFALTVSMAFSSLLQRWITRPILGLARVAAKVTATGDYSVRVEQQADDEVGRLCTAANRMLEHIESADKALKAAQEDLEQRVAERTAQLRAEIRQRELTQRELELAKNAAEEASRAKSAFLANMSHEIRTPLNAILGFTDLLLRGADEGNETDRRDYLNTIHSSGKHLLSLINDILDLSKIEAGKLPVEKIRFSPLELFEEVVSVLRVRAQEKGLSLQWEWRGASPGLIWSDPERLRQLLVNLVGNAIKFTERGGIRIVGRIEKRGERPQCVIQVIDTGIGIAPEKRDAVFDPFVQADSSVTRRYGGTGLGLAIGRRIAETLGGNLVMESEVGKGSVFTARIDCGSDTAAREKPAESPAAPMPTAPSDAPSPPPPPGTRILLVEDGDTNRKLIQIVLKRAGLAVETAENGRAGMERALRESYHLILMDMQMPVMDGYTATMLLREEGYSQPIVALTAHAMKGDELKCRQAGCTDYISKPVDTDLLLQVIGRCLAGHSPESPSAGEVAAASSCPGTSASQAAPPLVSRLPIDDPEFREIVVAFIERFRQQLQVMQEAWREGRLEELGRLAHWLKGSGGTAGYPILTEAARALGIAMHEGDDATVEEKLSELSWLSTRLVVPAEPPPAPIAAARGQSR